MTFQLVDDLLDFIATSSQLGKPAAADLRLGLATAPVLFAAQKVTNANTRWKIVYLFTDLMFDEQFPELNPLIMRRFQEPGDAELAFNLVLQSDGLQRTKDLATHYCQDAITQLGELSASPYKQALMTLAHQMLHRMK